MITIQTLQGTGIVKIESTPPRAQVSIDGEYYGVTPITIKDVEEGTHHYSLSYPGLQEHQGSVFVSHGQLCFNNVDLHTGIVDSTCPTALYNSNPMTHAESPDNIGNIGNIGNIQSMQAPSPIPTPIPTPIPGYIIISQSTVIWGLIGVLATILIYDYIRKR